MCVLESVCLFSRQLAKSGRGNGRGLMQKRRITSQSIVKAAAELSVVLLLSSLLHSKYYAVHVLKVSYQGFRHSIKPHILF